MKREAGLEGATKGGRLHSLTQRRLFYAERCENLIQALQFQLAVLRDTAAGGNETREAVARELAARVPEDKLEALFARIDALWAAWTRPETSTRNRETVERHARMALLAAVDQAVGILRVDRAQRALARRRLKRALGAEDEALVSAPEAAAAAALLEGKRHLVWTVYGTLEYGPEEEASDATIADGEPPDAASLIRWLVTQNGCPDLAQKLGDEQAERLAHAWPKHAGRPRRGRVANWDVISRTLVDLDRQMGLTRERVTAR
jgi:hypothetical protein